MQLPIEGLLFYLIPLFSSFALALIFTWWVKNLALKLSIVDEPNLPRKIHDHPIPLWGGLAIFLTLIPLMIVFWRSGWLAGDRISDANFFALVLASFLILLGGLADDKFNLKPGWQFIWPLAAVVVVMLSGIRVDYVTNPSGGVLWLKDWHPILPLLVAFVWLLGMTYTTKLLDGMDGLVGGIGAIGSVIIFIVSLSWNEPYSAVSVLALLLVGTCLGFLFFNFHPASIFLGESGSLLIGFWLGMLAIIAGSKIATGLLIMGIPILDVVWVIVRRLFFEKKSLAQADRKHLHHRLLALGWTQTRVAVFLYLLTLLFGSVALWQRTVGKIITFIILVAVMVSLGIVLVKNDKKNRSL